MLSEVAENIKGQARGQKGKNRRTGTEEQEQDSKERKNKSGKQRTKDQEQKNKNCANARKNKSRKTRTERQKLRQGTEKQDHRTGPKNKRGAHRTKDKQMPSKGHTSAKPTTPPRAPTPVLGRCNKQNNKQNNKTNHRHSCCRPNCTRPFGPRSVVTSTIPALNRAGYTLILFLLSPTLPLPPLRGVGGEDKVTNKTKTMFLNIIPPCLPQLVNKKKKKYIRKQHDNKTTHELQANLRADHGHS